MSYYKFELHDIVCVYMWDDVGSKCLAEVMCRYTTDKHNHPADRHKRYFVKIVDENWRNKGFEFTDVYENELSTEAEYEAYHQH